MSDADKDAQIADLTADLLFVVIDHAVTEAIEAERGSYGLLAPHVRPFVRVGRDGDGKPVAVVVDENGLRRLRPGATSTSDFMTVRDLVKTLGDDKEFGGAFDGSGSSGSGSNRGLEEPNEPGSARDRPRIL